MKLELLENRRLLSNVSVSFAGGALTILGDAHNDSFSITEQSAAAGGKVTVTSTSPQTTINKTSVPFVSPQAVTSIVVRLPGTTNSDTVSLLGAGKTTPTTVTNVTITGPVPTDLTLPIPPTAANLTFTANGVDNINGAFRLSAAALLTAHVDNSSFHTVVINQEGDSKAVVELGNNMIPGPAVVHEGYGNKDSITVDNGNLSGHTELYQGWVGDAGLGTADSVTVTNATTGNLDIEQLIDGTANTINVNTVSVALVSYGVTTTQGNGDKDTTTINLVTTPTPPNPLTALGNGPPSIAVAQGDGTVVPAGVTATGNDSASVTNSTLWGGISITQADVAGNAKGDSATISGDTLGFTIPFGPYVRPRFGRVIITQGNAPGDTAVLDQDVVNNVSITQGDNVQAPNGTTVVSDVAEINDTSVTSNVSISQGTGASTAINAGNYVAAIGYDYLGYMKGTPASSSVTVGGDTKIDQNYANNQVYLGDADSSFTTVYLDVFTGFGGGAFVMARNTTVDFGSLFGIYTIDGGGSGNTYVDGSGNSGVTVDPANFNFSTLLTPVLTWANPADITYGTALGATQLDATASVPGSFIYTPAAGTVLSAGANETLSVTFTPTDTTDYGPVTATAMINVNRAALLITANSATRVYGQQNPAFTVTYAGLTNGDSPSSLGGSLHFSTAATASSPVNTYSVVPGGLTSANYAITFAGAKLVVAPASLTITANNQSRVFGQPNPPLTVYYQGFVNGDTPASLTAPVVLSTPAVLASFAGSYPIFVGGAASPNYAIRLVSGTLAVMPPTDPVVLGHIAFVTSLDRDLLLRSPGPADLFSWLQQLNTGRSALHVASAINQLPERRAVLRSHHGVGISFAVALERAVKAQQHAIQNARRALK